MLWAVDDRPPFRFWQLCNTCRCWATPYRIHTFKHVLSRYLSYYLKAFFTITHAKNKRQTPSVRLVILGQSFLVNQELTLTQAYKRCIIGVSYVNRVIDMEQKVRLNINLDSGLKSETAKMLDSLGLISQQQ